MIQVLVVNLIEISLISILMGLSTMAVVSYGIVIKKGFPTSESGKTIAKAIFTIIRVAHFLVFIVVLINLILFGFLDANESIKLLYGFKMFLLVANAIVSAISFKHILRIEITAPLLAAGWYTLAGVSSYVLVNSAKTIPSLAGMFSTYIIYIVIMYIVFFALKRILQKNK